VQPNITVFNYEGRTDIEPACRIPGFFVLAIWSLGRGYLEWIKEWEEGRASECSWKKRKKASSLQDLPGRLRPIDRHGIWGWKIEKGKTEESRMDLLSSLNSTANFCLEV